MARKRRPAPPPPPEDIVIDVRAVTNAAFYAGLTVELAQNLLVEADLWSVMPGVCRDFCNGASGSFVVAQRAYLDRDVIYCEGCNLADLGV